MFLNLFYFAHFHFCLEIPHIQAIRITTVWFVLGYSKYLYEKGQMFAQKKSCSLLLDRQNLKILFRGVTRYPWGGLTTSMMRPNYVPPWPSIKSDIYSLPMYCCWLAYVLACCLCLLIAHVWWWLLAWLCCCPYWIMLALCLLNAMLLPRYIEMLAK